MTAIIYQRILRRLKALKKSARAASIEAAGKPDVIRQIKDGHQPGMDRVIKLAKVLKTSSGYLLGETDEDRPPAEPTSRAVPLLDLAMIGQWSDQRRDYDAPQGIQVVPDTDVSREAFAVVVQGNAMTAPDGREPTFRAGDLIIVDPNVRPNPGDFVIARVAESPEAIFAQYRVRRDRDSGRSFIELVPLNPAWPTLTLDWRQTGEVVATMVEHRRVWRQPRAEVHALKIA